MPPLTTAPYLEQRARWPQEGQHILAQHDQASVVVYQAYNPPIAQWSIQHQRLGGPGFRDTRMSWIKPNFLWMMYRSGWASKANQERVLALRLPRAFFEELLADAVLSSYKPGLHPDHESWRRALKDSQVRLQWDPDHDPHGQKVARRAVQLGLRGQALARMGHQELLEIQDITGLVHEQRLHVERGDLGALRTPAEAPLWPTRLDARLRADLAPPLVHVVDYDPAWPQRFEEIKARLWPRIKHLALGLEHVGSTSVPGLAAKPKVDMDIVVKTAQQQRACAQALEALGYQARGELGIEGRLALRRPPRSAPHNLYICLEGCASLRNHLAVRDHLRAHPEDARAYAQRKKELAQQHPWDMDAYTWGKTELLLGILGRQGFGAQELAAIREANRPST